MAEWQDVIFRIIRKFLRFFLCNTRTSTRTSNPTSTPQVQDKLHTDNLNIIKLMQIVGEQELSVKEIMKGLQSPRHPRQKYLLTVKGMALYNDITNNQ